MSTISNSSSETDASGAASTSPSVSVPTSSSPSSSAAVSSPTVPADTSSTIATTSSSFSTSSFSTTTDLSSSTTSILTTSSTTSTTPSSTSIFTPPTTSASTTSSAPPLSTSTTPQPTSSTSVSVSVFTEFTTSTYIPSPTSSESSSTSSASTSSGTAALITGSPSKSSGLSSSGKTAIAVVIPIVVVALLILGGIFFWRKRKQRKDAEELRRKEAEEYGYNPNNDPTLPAAGSQAGAYEMREEGASGYRGWGTTAASSGRGRKASTTLSGGQSNGMGGMAYSDTSPSHGAVSEGYSDNALMDSHPHEAEELGAMGPARNNNAVGVNRGISNASSSYSAANRSDGSGEMPGNGYGTAQYNYNDQYGVGNPYENYGSPPQASEMAGQPVIRDVQARRNTRIENPSHFPQQSAGISQNF